jgi:hypothetical protein
MIRDNRTSFSSWWYFVCFCTGCYFELGYYFVYPRLLMKTWLPVMALCGGCAPQAFDFCSSFFYND